MSRVTFETDKQHQERAAVWARQRLADAGGRSFSSRDDQDGVLLADAVGMGKTWEAIAAAALVLYKWDQPQRGKRHVLILCPANLVTKWEDELVDGSPLNEKLAAWRKKLERSGQTGPARRVYETLTTVIPIRSKRHVQRKKQRSRIVLPAGTYIVSQTFLRGKGHAVAALKRTEWDVVIVDEAHSAVARTALQKVEEHRRAKTKLLLSATPFQLAPNQWSNVAKMLVKSGHKVLDHASVAPYVDALSEVFASPTAPDPKPAVVSAASAVFQRIAARSVPRTTIRTYGVIMGNGDVRLLENRIDALDDRSVENLLAQLRSHAGNTRNESFDVAYFQRRVELALEPDGTYVANKLRHALSQGIRELPSPRLTALRRWSESVFANDIERMYTASRAEKTIVFSSLVGGATGRDAERIRVSLEDAFEPALATVRRRLGRRWQARVDEGRRRLLDWYDVREMEIVTGFQALAKDELACVLAGKVGVFRALLKSLRLRHRGIPSLRDRLLGMSPEQRAGLEGRTLKRRLETLKRSVAPWVSDRPLRYVERYTGSETRTERDRAATAFRDLGPPWVLVASNVGSEGIDLHTHTRRIVHYDLEWNPARMEQREGRGDRLGRKLGGPLDIFYCLVPDTYDERMFHQLVARDRWHGVLLGKPAFALADSATDAPLLSRERLERLRLDLEP